ncbi:hypothetical protein GQ457_06G028660 [Hibiscus cannabinus]
MENMQYADKLVREYLVFRGFTNTLQAFEIELCRDIGKGFQTQKFVGQFNFFEQCSSSCFETTMLDTLLKLEGFVLRCYIVHALQF